jgi:hypothetical protein
MELAALHLLIAAAGGGTSSFGGGGSSGGSSGGGFSSGGGSSGTGSGEGGGIGVLIIFAIVALFLLAGAIGAAKARKRRRERVRRTEAVAVEAAQDDVWFAADAVRRDAAELFRAVQQAWAAGDRATLAGLVGGDLMVEWRRRLDDFDAKGWRNEVRILGGPHVEYVGLENRDDDRRDRVVVRITASMHDCVITSTGGRLMHNGKKTPEVALAEYWTLQRAGDRWTVVSIEQDAEGEHHLGSALVASPGGDTQQLADETAAELAVAGATGPEVFALADVDFSDDARKAALDLSLLDERFATHVLEATARQALRAWAEAIDGEDAALLAMATPEAVEELLRPDGPQTRLVVRGPALERLEVAQLDRASLTIAATIRGRRYVEDRDTLALVRGSRDGEQSFVERFVLVPGDTVPWRIAGRAGRDGALAGATGAV